MKSNHTPAKFIKMTDAWNAGLREDLLHKVRLKRMTSGAGNICDNHPDDLSSYSPFTSATYRWSNHLGKIDRNTITVIQSADPYTLADGNVYKRSEYRDGWNIWDAAIGIPAAKLRGSHIQEYNKIQGIRHTNAHWTEHMLPALRHIGPLGYDRRIVRPEGPYILDLRRSSLGWTILEAAHALGHLRGDGAVPRHVLGWAQAQGETAGNFIGVLGEIIFSIMFNLPLDVSDRHANDPGEPDFCYGIEVKTSTNILDPVMKVPWNNNESPEPDRTFVVAQMGVRIEPHPQAYEQYTDAVTIDDRWCCMPSVVTFAGWEGIDVITHQPLGQASVRGEFLPRAPVSYVLRAEDMMEPGLMWGVLMDGRETFGMPEVSDTRRYFHEWIESPEYAELLANTPPLICKDCMTFVRTEFAPRRPRKRVDKHDEDYEEQLKRKEDVKRVAELVNTAIEKHEIYLYGGRRKMLKARKERRRMHNKRLRQYKKDADFITLHYKKLKCGHVPAGKLNPVPKLTVREEKKYREYIQRYGQEYCNKVLQAAVNKGYFNV